jgi:hypothetical protein
MQRSLSRQVLTTAIYIVVLFVVLWGDNILIHWALRHIIASLFGWFYGLKLVFKILFIVFTGPLTVVIISFAFRWINEVVSKILAHIFIYNDAIYYIAALMAATNIALSTIAMWGFLKWDFWSVIFGLLIFYFTFRLNWVFVLKNRGNVGPDPYAY